MMNSGKIVLKNLMMDFQKIHHLKIHAIRFFALLAFILVLTDLTDLVLVLVLVLEFFIFIIIIYLLN